MKLPEIFEKIVSPNNSKKELFIALEITPVMVKAAIWTNKEGAIELLGTSKKEHSDNWEEVIKAADVVITEASSNLPENVTIQKVIFGLPSFWIKDNKIEPEHLSNLKKLCTELDLKPLGFVTIPEAIANFLQKQEGSPLTALLIGIDKDNLIVSLIRVGKMDNVISKQRGDKLIEDVNTAFSEFTNVEVLPSRILLFDSENDLESAKQELIAFPWQTKSAFLHFPKIEILEINTDIKAVALAGGMELSKKLDIRLVEEETAEKQEEAHPVSAKDNTLGFVKDRDILEEMPQPKEERSTKEEKEEPKEEIHPPKLTKKFSFVLPKIALPKISIPLPALPNLMGQPKLIVGGLFLAILTLGISGFLFYWYVPKATVNLLVDPKIIERDEEVIGNPNTTEIDEPKKIIPITITQINQSGTKTASATGEKTIGEKAHGEIIIYNKTNNEKSFKAGDILIAGNNLKFSLNADVTVASQSASKTGTTFGITKAKITAAQIGSEGNLQANTDFSFKEYPSTSYAASNEVEFTGGSARKITVISKDDQKNLLENLISELNQKLKEESIGKIPSDSVTIEQELEPKIVRKVFDKEEGTQSENVTLTLEIQNSIPNYKISDLEKIITDQFSASIPDGYEFKPSELSVQSRIKEIKKDGTIIFNAHFEVRLLPKIDIETVKKNIVGKNPKVVEAYFREFQNLAGFEIILKPQLPLSIQTLPHQIKNISVAITFRK